MIDNLMNPLNPKLNLTTAPQHEDFLYAYTYAFLYLHTCIKRNTNCFSMHPDNKGHGANMGPTWVLSAPGGPHVGPMILAIRGLICLSIKIIQFPFPPREISPPAAAS